MSGISFSELRDALDCNREIEFSLCERQYFADVTGCPPVIGCSGDMKDPACSLNWVSKLSVTVTNCCIQLLLPYLR